jgi:capsular polysaccharide biosynthesis protein
VTLCDALSVLRIRWVTVAVVTLLATLAAVAVAFLTPPQYGASTTIFISTPETKTAEQAYSASRFSQGRATSYRDLMVSESLTARTVARLNLEESPRELARRVKATANPDSVVLRLSVTDRSSQHARDLANALSDDFVRMVKELETPADGGPAMARAVVIKGAGDATWVSPDRRKIIAFGAISGLLLGSVVALMRGSRKADGVNGSRSRVRRRIPSFKSPERLPTVEFQNSGETERIPDYGASH